MDRRDFLRRTAFGAAALAAAKFPTPPARPTAPHTFYGLTESWVDGSRLPAPPRDLINVDASCLTARQWEPPASAQVTAIDGEFDRLEVSGSGGTYTLSLHGECTGPIAFDASPLAVASALEALSTIQGVTIEPIPDKGYTIQFNRPDCMKAAA